MPNHQEIETQSNAYIQGGSEICLQRQLCCDSAVNLRLLFCTQLGSVKARDVGRSCPTFLLRLLIAPPALSASDWDRAASLGKGQWQQLQWPWHGIQVLVLLSGTHLAGFGFMCALLTFCPSEICCPLCNFSWKCTQNAQITSEVDLSKSMPLIQILI